MRDVRQKNIMMMMMMMMMIMMMMMMMTRALLPTCSSWFLATLLTILISSCIW